MGKRGPAPKPTNLKVLQGNPGKRQLNESEPVFPIGSEVPNPPAHLSRYAKKEWKRIAPLLHKNGLLTEADIAALGAYCQAYNRWVEAEKLIRTYGYTDETDKGNIIQRPEVGIANKAMEQMVKYGKEFGLTPSARSNLHIEKPEETEDPFMKFISGGRSG
ncbi:phage terminase, small subunit, P27 family [Peptoclostridium acidaminophilum DSM 3953]|uniref:Phage terminase, small subunit, P27 family n=1 Tax=Peptoclostridium acidaminophilum DSM 3953 TaxID=1286171 RepID=W8T684_PEPAC|nr:phage terminase small subunit P27 family [Peptoclostridium acidaminophilum]AHM56400.1 phage terminase, small subunit, P27 family [Peptoclostridium acidaminophilum DSM 3953]